MIVKAPKKKTMIMHSENGAEVVHKGIDVPEFGQTICLNTGTMNWIR